MKISSVSGSGDHYLRKTKQKKTSLLKVPRGVADHTWPWEKHQGYIGGERRRGLKSMRDKARKAGFR